LEDLQFVARVPVDGYDGGDAGPDEDGLTGHDGGAPRR